MRIRSAALVVILSGISIASGEAQVAKASKNLIRNGDFSAGILHWVGDGKVDVFKAESATPETSESGSDVAKPVPRVAATLVPARPPHGAGLGKPGADVDRAYFVTLGSRSLKFYQSISVPRNTKALKVAFRARTTAGFLTSRGSLGALLIRIERPDRSSTYSEMKIENKPDWQAFNQTLELQEYSRSVNLAIEIFPGDGQLYFDDFVVEALDK